MLRFVSRHAWLVVFVVVAAFVWFTNEISKPVGGSLKASLGVGSVHAAPELEADDPVLLYVALYDGKPSSERPAYPLDEQLAEDDGSFAFTADRSDGSTFFVFARIETAKEELFCATDPLPEMRIDDDRWVVAATGEPLEARRLTVDKSRPCRY